MCMIHESGILVIVGSVRKQRICRDVADWVGAVGREIAQVPMEVVDLRDWPLPMDDEAGIPAAHPYDTECTRDWSRKIAAAKGFVFVTPQYNWGYPAALKNALDHLYKEWSGKPALIVTYGSHGGSRCARQLREVLKGLHMKPVGTMPGLKLTKDRIKANEGTIDAGAVFAGHESALRRGFEQLDAAIRSPRRWWPW
ncbi:MAG: NAD(P)H-dependent oxidoreductase [Proteobacteria bacterium]|nr:NAD(P)H-dependent oxidoreductase [Pseudomonadota bacterium]